MNKHLKALTIALGCALMLSGCAHSYVDSYEPIIDQQGVNPAAYAHDLSECRKLAVSQDPANKAAQDALIGAVAGAALGLALGGGAYGGQLAAFGAADGAATGALYGGATGVAAQQIIMKRCMGFRGYRVLY